MLKKLLVSSLLLCFCVLSCMLPVRYGLKLVAKSTMTAQLQEQAYIERASFLMAADSLADAEWEGDSEFRLHNHLYDVAGIVYKDGHKYYRCINDELEARLEHKADDLAAGVSANTPDNPNGRLVKSLVNWLQDLYFHHCIVPQIRSYYGRSPVYCHKAVQFPGTPFLDCRIIPPEA